MQFAIPDEKVEELRQIVEEEFGEPVSVDEARVMAAQLLDFYDLLSRMLLNIMKDIQHHASRSETS